MKDIISSYKICFNLPKEVRSPNCFQEYDHVIVTQL